MKIDAGGRWVRRWMLLASIIFVSAVAKSAQFSLHVRLLDAMEGPTPILALIHASQSYLT